MENLWTPTLKQDRVSAVIVRDGKILLMHRFRDGKEYWVLPGGSIEEGETPEKALAREVEEETSLTVLKKQFLFTIPHLGRSEHHWLITDHAGSIKLAGPEAERVSRDNQFLLTWVALQDMGGLEDFYPEKAQEELLSLWDKKIL